MHRNYLFSLFFLYIFSLFFSFFTVSDGAFAKETDSDRPKIGLVLAGGGARGGAHIGVLQILEENRIPIDYIAGTSFGAIVGSLYAAGYSADTLNETLNNLNWDELLSDSAPRKYRSMVRKRDDEDASIDFEMGFKNGKFVLPNGLVRGNQLRLKLSQLLSSTNNVQHFDHLPIPFRALSADLLSGDQVVMEDGNLASAVMASMSVPGLFPPFERDGRLLVDGGIVNNLPVDIVRQMGADIVIVVDIGAPKAEREDITSFTSVLRQMISLLTRKSRQEQLDTLSEQDILITPDLEGISLTAFSQIGETVSKGLRAATAQLPALKNLQVSDEEWHRYNLHRKIQPIPATLDFIRVKNASSVSNDFIRKNLSLKPGDRLDETILAKDLSYIYGSGSFEHVDYQIITENGETGVEVTATERAIGNDLFRFGLSLEDDFSGTSNYSLSVIYTKRNLNSLGAEWRNKITLGNNIKVETLFYQPLDKEQRFYSFASGGLLRTTIGILDDDGGELVNTRIDVTELTLGGGYTFSNWGQLTVGLQRAIGEYKFLSAVPDFAGIPINTGDEFDIQQSSLFVHFDMDTLDNAHFPHSGTRLYIRYQDNMSFLGGESTLDTLSFDMTQAFSWGPNTIISHVTAGGAYGGDQTPADNFTLGGFRNLSGLKKDAISGRYFGLLGTEYRRQLNQGRVSQIFGVPLYAGLTLEAGNVWNHEEDIAFDTLLWGGSLYVGADTPFGPLYFGSGYTSGGNKSVFLYMGSQF